MSLGLLENLDLKDFKESKEQLDHQLRRVARVNEEHQENQDQLVMMGPQGLQGQQEKEVSRVLLVFLVLMDFLETGGMMAHQVDQEKEATVVLLEKEDHEVPPVFVAQLVYQVKAVKEGTLENLALME